MSPLWPVVASEEQTVPARASIKVYADTFKVAAEDAVPKLDAVFADTAYSIRSCDAVPVVNMANEVVQWEFTFEAEAT